MRSPGDSVGMLSLFYAVEATIKKAAARGIALISVSDAWMSGRSAYCVETIANASLVASIWSEDPIRGERTFTPPQPAKRR